MRLLILVSIFFCPALTFSSEKAQDVITLAYDVKPNPPYYFGDGVDVH